MWRWSRTTGWPARALAALGARIVPDTPARGLNAALAHGAARVRARRPGAAVAALNADLPALRPAELDLVLHSAARFPRAFLADAADIGTTLLTATSGVELAPAFGGASRARHLASGAHGDRPRPGCASVRRDVDTGEDLLAALALGVGPHTALQAPHLAGGAATGAVAPDGPTAAAAAAGQSVWSVIRAIMPVGPVAGDVDTDPLAGPQQQQAAGVEGRRIEGQRGAVVQQHAAGAGLGVVRIRGGLHGREPAGRGSRAPGRTAGRAPRRETGPARGVAAAAESPLARRWSSWRWSCVRWPSSRGPSSPWPSWPGRSSSPSPSWRWSSSPGPPSWRWPSWRLLRRGLLGGGLLRRRGLLRRGVFFAVAFFAGGLLGGGLLGGGLLDGGATGEAALGRLLDGDLAALGELLRAAHQVLEALTGAEARHRGLLDPYALTRLRVAGVAGRAVDLLERAESGDRNAVAGDNCTDDCVQYRVDRVRGVLAAAELVGNRFYELRLVHVFPFGDIAGTKVFQAFSHVRQIYTANQTRNGLITLVPQRTRPSRTSVGVAHLRESDPRRGLP